MNSQMITAIILITVFCLAAALLLVLVKRASLYRNNADERNPMEGKKIRFVRNPDDPVNADGEYGHLEATGKACDQRSLYDRVWKRILDIILSFAGLIILSPFFLLLCIAIEIDNPGPVFFCQKRVGENKRYFMLHKFRSMKTSTPHNVPTHMLQNPERYITKVGRFLRKSSLDELPQIFDILIGNMSIIGPRPALWNQDSLVAGREPYGANEIRPGLTGWAQINGRDDLSLSDKAKLDGDYAKRLRCGGWKAFLFDCRCFFGTIFSVLRNDGVTEGATADKQALREQDQ